jgi:ATP-dependent helicase/nuclease subunit A
MSTVPGLPDDAARDRIRTDTASTLFVDAGAGSGKTTALVGRVLRLVLEDGIPLHAIAAVTFTEKAGAELRDRLRVQLEDARRHPDNEAHQEITDRALDDLDGAAIGTLHSFAQRILLEHPIEAGLPPVVEVLDEVGSGVAFDERWSGVQTSLLDDDDTAPALLLAMAGGVTFAHLRALTAALGRDWDLISDRVLPEPAAPLDLDLTAFTAQARETVRLGDVCTADDDNLLLRLQRVESMLDELATVTDDPSRLTVLVQIADVKFGKIGQKGNWGNAPEPVRDAGRELVAEAARVVGQVQNRCIRALTRWLAVRVLDAAADRRREGQLEFHDLLVLARNLLRRDAAVRADLHQTYRRVLLDEFQDTDPIQIELATRICGGEGADASDWRNIALPAGRLFVVGDPKQSIYRFRRASIATYLSAAETLGERVALTTNFRSVGPVLDWVNGVFGELIVEQRDAQPAYVPLDVARPDTGSGPAVVTLGAAGHEDKPKAALLREREALDVAAVISQALAEQWQVWDKKTEAWRAARHGDIAVLVPSRTSLPFLEDALETAGVPYRAEASSLVYQSGEVRDLLACARAIGDTSDALSLVTTLRSALFGCGDDDLWAWRAGGGSFTIFSTVDDVALAAGPVGTALGYLKVLYNRSRWMTPSEILATIVADRRMLELAATVAPRPRDSWRRLRFVVDQARAWSEVSQGGLRSYLAWAARQGLDVGRVAEAVLPETDADAVRILTMHAAKGLEFPIVVMSGMTSQANRQKGVQLLWPPAGGYQAKLTGAAETDDFDTVLPVDEQMDDLERLRLLYVGATRARDHLVVSLHRSLGQPRQAPASLIAGTSGARHAMSFVAGPIVVGSSLPSEVGPPPDHAAWTERVETARTRTRTVPAQSASGLEGTEPEVELNPAALPGLAKGARDLELPPWSKGRYGSAIGRAVHAVLQTVDLATGDGLDAAVAAQSLAEGVVGQDAMVRSLVRSALASDLVQRAAVREHWRETYVGAELEDGSLLEGYIDLIFRDDDDDGQLVVVDYKTDSIPAGAVDSRVVFYKPQMDAYRATLAKATGVGVSAVLLFLHPETSVARDVS